MSVSYSPGLKKSEVNLKTLSLSIFVFGQYGLASCHIFPKGSDYVFFRGTLNNVCVIIPRMSPRRMCRPLGSQ